MKQDRFKCRCVGGKGDFCHYITWEQWDLCSSVLKSSWITISPIREISKVLNCVRKKEIITNIFLLPYSFLQGSVSRSNPPLFYFFYIHMLNRTIDMPPEIYTHTSTFLHQLCHFQSNTNVQFEVKLCEPHRKE